MKTILATAAVLLAATTAQAQDADPPKTFTVSGSVGLVNDYRFRGVSQSDEDLAVQGGITITHESGLYVGTWGSNLAGWGTFGGSNTELDIFGGFKFPLAEGITVDAGLLWYMYPGGASKTDFAEPYVKLSGTVGPASVTVGVAYAPKQQALGRWYFTGADAAAGIYNDPGDKEDNLYVFGDVAAAIPQTPVALKAHLGYSDGNRGLGPNATSVAPTGKYLDWLVGADFSLGTIGLAPLTVGVAYVDTDISNREAAYLRPSFSRGQDGTGNIAGSKILVSLTAAF